MKISTTSEFQRQCKLGKIPNGTTLLDASGETFLKIQHSYDYMVLRLRDGQSFFPSFMTFPISVRENAK